jgi:phage tail-like protein
MPSEEVWNNNWFDLEIRGSVVAQFRECTGFKTTSDVFVIQEGGLNGSVHKLPGQSKWNTITLKRGMTGTTEFIAWRDEYLASPAWTTRPTTSGAIVHRDADGSELRRYSFTGAFPNMWEGPALNAGGSDLAVETLEIAYDSITINAGSATPPPSQEPPPPPPPVPNEIVAGPVQFEFDSARLTPAGREALAGVSEQIDANDIKEMWVEGHTCDLSEGKHAYNKNLSTQRAIACQRELESSNPGTRFHAQGFSWDHPVAPNDVESNRAKNRRTQFFTSDRGADSDKRSGELTYVRYNNRR